jgi:hypothetical protein
MKISCILAYLHFTKGSKQLVFSSKVIIPEISLSNKVVKRAELALTIEKEISRKIQIYIIAELHVILKYQGQLC